MRRPVARAARSLAALALVATLAACDRAQRYATTPEVARARLAGTVIPDIAFGKAAHGGPGEVTADGVRWAVKNGFADAAAGVSAPDAAATLFLRAKVAASGEGTEVTVDLAPPPGVDAARLQALFDQHPAMAKLFRSVAAEQVDSVLTARPFSFSNIRATMALAVVAELPNIREQMNEADEAIDERDRDTMHRAYDQAKD